MPNIPAVTQEPKPAEIPATEQNVSEMTSSIVGRYSIFQIHSVPTSFGQNFLNIRKRRKLCESLFTFLLRSAKLRSF